MTKIDLGNTNNEKIEDLNMLALRKYACAKVNHQPEWYLKCIDCVGNKDCSVGRRVNDILDTQTKPEKSQIEKFNERLQKMKAKGKFKPSSDPYISAMKTDDPLGYLVDNGYFNTRWRAKDAVKRWSRNHGIDKEPFIIDICRPYKSVDFGTKDKEGKPVIRSKYTPYSIQMMKEIIESCGSGQELIETLGARGYSTTNYSTLYKFIQNYPEYEKKYPFIKEACHIMQKNYVTRRKAFSAETETPVSGSDTDGDEVSIADFLNEEKPDIQEDNSKTSEAVKDYPPAVTSAPPKNETVHPTDSQKMLVAEFSRKRKEIREKIADLDSARKALGEKLRMLDETASLFGLKAIEK